MIKYMYTPNRRTNSGSISLSFVEWITYKFWKCLASYSSKSSNVCNNYLLQSVYFVFRIYASESHLSEYSHRFSEIHVSESEIHVGI